MRESEEVAEVDPAGVDGDGRAGEVRHPADNQGTLATLGSDGSTA